MATFVDGVNRLLRINQIIRGDDDNIADFTETQHAADISLAQISVQDELAEIVSDRLIPYEKASSTVALVSGTRAYALAADFIRFFGIPSFYDSTDNTRIYEHKGGEELLMNQDYQYKTTTGAPMSFYWENSTTKQVAFYNIPNSTYDSRSLSYDYEKSVMVSAYGDTLPFHSNEEYYSFISCAARRFFFMKSDQELGLLTKDATYNNAKSRLYSFLNPRNPIQHYGHGYR